MTITTQSIRLLNNMSLVEDGKVVFYAEDDDTYEPVTEIAITQDDWQEFGSPSVLTVTIQPGDHLN